MATAAMQQTEPACPKCGGRMWDNRPSKRNPKAPDFKCRNRSCDGVVWPPGESRSAAPNNAPRTQGVNLGRTGVSELDADVDADEARFVAQVRGADQTTADQSSARLNRIFAVQESCFSHALTLARQAKDAGIPVTLEGVSALTAQALIAFKDGR